MRGRGHGEDCDEGTCAHTPCNVCCLGAQDRWARAGMHQADIHFSLGMSSPRARISRALVPVPAHTLALSAVNWLDHGRTLREQGIDDNETLLLRRKFFYSDQNVDSRDPVQLNLLYVQVQLPRAPGSTASCQPLTRLVAEGFVRSHDRGVLQDTQLCPG